MGNCLSLSYNRDGYTKLSDDTKKHHIDLCNNTKAKEEENAEADTKAKEEANAEADTKAKAQAKAERRAQLIGFFVFNNLCKSINKTLLNNVDRKQHTRLNVKRNHKANTTQKTPRLTEMCRRHSI